MDTLANKVKVVRIPLDVEDLEFKAPLEEKFMCHEDLIVRDAVLVDDVNPPDEFTEMRII